MGILRCDTWRCNMCSASPRTCYTSRCHISKSPYIIYYNSLVRLCLPRPSTNSFYYDHYYYNNYNYKWRLILLIVSSSPSSMTRHPPLRLQWPISCLVYTFLHSPLSIHLLYYFPTPPTSAATTTTTSTTTILLLLSSRSIRSPVLLHTSPRLCRDPTISDSIGHFSDPTTQ